MTNFKTMLKQQAVFSLKVFFAPLYGSYLAIREAMTERAALVERDETLAWVDSAVASSTRPIQNLVVVAPAENRGATGSSASSKVVVLGLHKKSHSAQPTLQSGTA
ncbi:MAG: hypothetical protein M0D54_06145 [Hyphomonadaceae bacterium JAD_PAG50586_4]|nr:MAG: hypothetical protein M0D54_06145 [Hyphomonadaceae bacterium JAD_PAG50586_4]